MAEEKSSPKPRAPAPCCHSTFLHKGEGTPVLAGVCGFVSRAVGMFTAPFSPSPASLFSVFLSGLASGREGKIRFYAGLALRVLVGHWMGATEVPLNNNMERLDIRTGPCKILTRPRERNSSNGSVHCSMRFENLAAPVRRRYPELPACYPIEVVFSEFCG